MTSFKDKIRRLSLDDINAIQSQYDAAMDTDHGSGEHWILIGVLNQKGFPVKTVEDAFDVAGKILALWYQL